MSPYDAKPAKDVRICRPEEWEALTAKPADRKSPYGYDADGKRLAPYGVKLKSGEPAKRRGRLTRGEADAKMYQKRKPSPLTPLQAKTKAAVAKANSIAGDASAGMDSQPNVIGGDIAALLPSDKADPLAGLTEQQASIARLSLRGMRQAVIGTILGISQPTVSRELAVIRAHLKNIGEDLDQAEVVGRARTVYQEVQYRGWELYAHADASIGDKSKALQVIMAAQDKQNRLLMDLGLMKRDAQTVNHVVSASKSPFLEALEKQGANIEVSVAARSVIESQFEALPPPSPPEDIEDAEFMELEDDEEEDDETED